MTHLRLHSRWSIHITKDHASEAYGGSGGKVLFITDLDTTE
jgi:hypothetical protein